MTQEDLVKSLGTLAKSGTSDFLKALENNTADMNLIGKFGVGFYSAYLVADKVRVVTKHNTDKQLIWESSAQNEFTIAEDPRGNTLGRGTEITLFLKPNTLEFLEDTRLKELVQKYSQFINFPIYLWVQKTVTEEVPIEEDKAEKPDEDKADAKDAEKPEEDVEDATEDKKDDDKPKTKSVEKKVEEWEKVNTNKPSGWTRMPPRMVLTSPDWFLVWIRNPKDVTEEEYNEFYKAFTKENDDPLSYIHFKAEGEHEFRSIIFVPAKPAPSFLQQAEESFNRNIKLYVRRVFITDELVDFLPRWLAFIKGVVDSDDFPLNVSRETIQQHSILNWIKKKLVSKAIELFKTLSKDEEKYPKFLESFGVTLKLGAIEDRLNQKKLLRLLRFQSSHDNSTSILDYIERMKKNQTQIYYLTGASVEEIKKSPLLEKILAREYEVLYCSDPIDEYLWQQVTTFSPKSGETYTFQNAAKAGLKFGDEDEEAKKTKEAREEEFKPLLDWLKIALIDVVEKVQISDLLTKSPMAIVANQWGWTGGCLPMPDSIPVGADGTTGNTERLMQGQVFKQQEQNYMMEFQRQQKKILDINDGHPIIKSLLKKVQDGDNDDKATEMVRTLYEMALVRSGYGIPGEWAPVGPHKRPPHARVRHGEVCRADGKGR
ncbi:heat shock protein Hsp90 family [Hyaloraphidium curvatum]|nr:heat shock protein Hsp90 family [Hyaloraphidium curvatum]